MPDLAKMANLRNFHVAKISCFTVGSKPKKSEGAGRQQKIIWGALKIDLGSIKKIIQGAWRSGLNFEGSREPRPPTCTGSLLTNFRGCKMTKHIKPSFYTCTGRHLITKKMNVP